MLPEEWLIERNQQVGANSCNLLSPSFIVICGSFAAVFCNLRYIFVTALAIQAECAKELIRWSRLIRRLTATVSIRQRQVSGHDGWKGHLGD
jgi:hypothetical protein